MQNNLSGSTHGNMSVIGPSSKTKDGDQYWLCQCECGNKFNLPTKKIVPTPINPCNCTANKAIKHVSDN